MRSRKVSLSSTHHCGVQEGGDVEDLVESQCRVDALVLLAGAEKKTRKHTRTHTKGGNVIFRLEGK